MYVIGTAGHCVAHNGRMARLFRPKRCFPTEMEAMGMTNHETILAIPDNDDWQSRIVKTPGILAGKPCIRGTRISVELVDELLRGGRSPEDIRRCHFSHISLDDIEACRQYAATGAKLSDFTWRDLYGDEDDD